jgi:hypothetical protein
LPRCQTELHTPGPAGHDHCQPRQRIQHHRLFHPAAQWRPQPAKGGGAYSGLFPIPATENEYLGKYDQNLGEKDHVAVTYFYSKNVLGNSPGGNVPWTINNNVSAGTNINLSDVHTFSPTTANQTWLTFTRAAGGRVNLPFTGPASQTLASYGSNFLIQGPVSLPTISETNFSATATNAGPFTGSDNYELRDMVSMVKGKHSLFIGGEFALDKTMFDANLLNFGSISFATSAPTSTGNVTSDWVTGQASSFEQDSPYTTHLSTWHYAVFAQDNYRITPRFTANLGVRWDIDTPPVDPHNRTESFIPGQQSTVAPLAPKGLCSPVTRASAAASSPPSTTTFRRASASRGTRLVTARPPFAAARASSSAMSPATSGTSPAMPFHSPCGHRAARVPSVPSPISTRRRETSPRLRREAASSRTPIRRPSPHSLRAPAAQPKPSPAFQIPYVYQFNLSVQRQLPGRVTMTAAYVSALSHHLPNFLDANYAPYSTAFGRAKHFGKQHCRAASIRSLPHRGCPTGAAAINNGNGLLGAQIIDLLSDLTGSYHSLQISAIKQLSSHFSAGGNYVWSHALDSFEPVRRWTFEPAGPRLLGRSLHQPPTTLWAPSAADFRRNTAI